MAIQGMERQGWSGRGGAEHGEARRGEARIGEARPGMARRGWAWPGKASTRKRLQRRKRRSRQGQTTMNSTLPEQSNKVQGEMDAGLCEYDPAEPVTVAQQYMRIDLHLYFARRYDARQVWQLRDDHLRSAWALYSRQPDVIDCYAGVWTGATIRRLMVEWGLI